MSRSDVGELRTYKNWEWKGHSFEVRTEYMRAVGLVDGEVICDLTNTVCEAVVEELYDYGKYLVSNDSSQNGYNCVLCSEVFLDRDEWEKHSHIVHFEEFSEPWTSSILEEKRQDGSVSILES